MAFFIGTSTVRKMSNDELAVQWRRNCSNITGKAYYELIEKMKKGPVDPPAWFLYDDEVRRRHIASKYNIVTLDRKAQEYLSEIYRKEREEKEKEEIERKTVEFMEILKKSDMVNILADKINMLEYDAYYIHITTNEVIIYKNMGKGENGTKLKQMDQVKFFNYNYPDLEKYQVAALKTYLPSQLLLNYAEVSEGLQLAETDPRMRTSW